MRRVDVELNMVPHGDASRGGGQMALGTDKAKAFVRLTAVTTVRILPVTVCCLHDAARVFSGVSGMAT